MQGVRAYHRSSKIAGRKSGRIATTPTVAVLFARLIEKATTLHPLFAALWPG